MTDRPTLNGDDGGEKSRPHKEAAAFIVDRDRHIPEWKRIWLRFRRHRLALVGAFIVFVLLIVGAAPGLFAPYDPLEPEPKYRGEAPTLVHPLGRDELGRDLLSRIIYGSRIALVVGFVVTSIAMLVGLVLGLLGGYLGGWVETAVMGAVDALMSFPRLLLVMAIVALIGPGLRNVVIGLGLTMWGIYARLVRAEVLSLRENEFVMAARATGATGMRIISRHLLPNVLAPVIVMATLDIGLAILLESTLSFLGLGIQPPEPSWGSILGAGRAYILRFPHISTFPGIAITITVLGFNLLGDGLRDALDPRLR
jgi:peptide/nickel transport system permease protein